MYTIIDKQTVVTTTVYTKVKFDFMEDEIVIPHVNPQTEADIILGIENREISELKKIEDEKNI